ncbi:hypothetical protein BH24ACI5_BH24ACI5_17140 [soil metagenome]
MNEAEHSDVKHPLPPYVPYRTFVNFLDSLHNVVMPSHIDKGVMSSMSGGVQSWLKASLRSMKLIDVNDVPQERLKKLVSVTGEDRKPVLRELFNATYAPLLKGKIDLQAATTPKLKAAIGDLGAQGETIDKCAAFLMALAKDSGLTLSPHLKRATPVRRRPRHARPQQVSGTESEDGQNVIEVDPESTAKLKAVRTITLRNTGGSLTLSGDFNPFDLVGAERDVVYKLIDVMNDYEAKAGSQAQVG